MNISDVKERLKSTGFPVAYRAFEKPTVPPFIVYLSEGDNNFAADGTVYFAAHQIRIELYTARRDLSAEGKVEAVLADVYYEKSVIYIESEKVYETIYELEV